jgi:MHS family shikimate/dehydroshikimate transporter-like MFS transporter
VRYTGISLVYQGGASIGGFMPLVALLMLSVFDGSPWAVASLLSAVAIITAIGALGLTKTWNSQEHSEESPAELDTEPRTARV